MAIYDNRTKHIWATPILCSLMLIGCGGEAADDVDDGEQVGVAVSALSFDTSVGSENSAWSGLSAAVHATLSRDPATNNDYVQGFTMEEKSDEPCKFTALFNDVDDPTDLDGNETWNRCDGSSGNFLFDHMNNDYRTTGVAVCLNSARDRMKGFALIGRYPECILDPNGTTPTGAACNGAGPRSDAVQERTNCPGSENGVDGDWEDEAECDPGYVVTGIEINHRAGGGNRRMMTGVRAICHKLQE